MRKRKTKDLENRLFNAGEKHEGNCQDREKKKNFQTSLPFSGPKCNQS